MFGGFLAYGSGSEDARHANSDEARRILKKIREKSSKHACGVIMRCLYGEFTRLAEMLRRSGTGQENHTASHGPRVKDHTGSRWTMPSEDAVIRVWWVDFDWRWRPSSWASGGPLRMRTASKNKMLEFV